MRVHFIKRVLLLMLFMTGAQVLVDAAPFVVLNDGRRMEGIEIRARSNGDVILTTQRGDITYAKDQYSRAVADKPDNWDALARNAEANPQAAIPLLQEIIREYANLDWDLRAMALLGETYINADQPEQAIDTYEDLFRESEAASASDVRWSYYKALLETEKYNKLELELNQEIADGDREAAARAQVMRGDILLKQGDVEGAAFDFLKTVLLFKAQEDVQPEALYKAGNALKRMKDDRAAAQFTQVVQTYPQTEWADKARQEL